MRFDGRTYDPTRDFHRLKTQLAKTFAILLDGEWHSLPELRDRCGSAADSRIRDLRKPRFGELQIYAEVRDEKQPGVWWYSLDLGSVEEAIGEAILEGEIKASPTPSAVPDDENGLKAGLHDMVERLSDGKALRNAYRAVKRALEADESAEAENPLEPQDYGDLLGDDW